MLNIKRISGIVAIILLSANLNASASFEAREAFREGNKYYFGENVTKDYKKAAEFWKKACDGGDANGCFNLGTLYTNGEGVSQDENKGKELKQKACEMGYIRACTTAKFVGADDLESFPSEYLNKPIFLRCERVDVKEGKAGNYRVRPTCEKSNGQMDIMSTLGFKINFIMSDKEEARKLAKSGSQPKLFFGELIINREKYAMEKYIFDIHEIQY